jgi:SSS family solute:Na+ symporter
MHQMGGGQLYIALQLVQALIAPAIAAVFILGIASKFVSPVSGLIGLLTGFLLGLSRLILQTMDEVNGAVYPAPIQAFVDINWLYFAFLLFVFTCVVVLAVSLVTPKASAEKIAGLTADTVTPEQHAAVRASYGTWDVIHSVAILSIIAGVYIYFW